MKRVSTYHVYNQNKTYLMYLSYTKTKIRVFIVIMYLVDIGVRYTNSSALQTRNVLIVTIHIIMAMMPLLWLKVAATEVSRVFWIHVSIASSITSIGTKPRRITSQWNSRMSNWLPVNNKYSHKYIYTLP